MSALRRFGVSLAAARSGVRHAWVSQPHFRFEVAAAAAAIALALVLGAGLVAVLLASALVLVAEVVNTSVEALVDHLAPEHRPLAGVAKDAAAGAVLIAAVFAVLVGLVAMGPALWARLFGGGAA